MLEGEFYKRFLEASKRTRLDTSQGHRKRQIASYLFPDDPSDISLCKLEFQLESGKAFDISSPMTFGEKIQVIKLFDRNPLYPKLVDKFHVREFVGARIDKKHLNKIHFVAKNYDDITWSALPETTMMKATHGWNMNMEVRSSQHPQRSKQLKQTINHWLDHDHGHTHAEWAYSQSQRQIIFEEYLGPELTDYKFYCFSGEVLFVKVDCERTSDQATLYLDPHWGHLPFSNPRVRRPKEAPQAPPSLDRMVELAEHVSKGFRFMRVDFYEVDDNPIFGEITLYPSAGNIWFNPPEWNITLGNLIDVSDLRFSG